MRARPSTRLAVALVVVLATVSLLPALGPVPASADEQADEPVPTTTTVTVSGGRYGGEQATITARVTSPAGVPTGTVQFSRSRNPIGEAVPVDADGVATTVVTAWPGTAFFEATFTGSDGFGDSQGFTISYTNLIVVKLTPEPFMTRPSPLQVRYALVARATRYDDGTPISGLGLQFTHGSAYAPNRFDPEPPGSKLACRAITDANGVARCGPLQSLTALQSRDIWVSHQYIGMGRYQEAFARIPLR
ncbi:Ig-like domain-containing protein [Nocardioides sp. SYSU DS0651]|uniref:Ig-like domain-containing protein n=1 Tax=Nocardioides sp. SYSU DS0651 TaxID=3415955 RepID=UPI003F4C9A63